MERGESTLKSRIISFTKATLRVFEPPERLEPLRRRGLLAGRNEMRMKIGSEAVSSELNQFVVLDQQCYDLNEI